MDIVLGAGVTGLSYTMFSKRETLVLEKEEEYGGYCRTIKKDGFIWDYSGHFFHFQDNRIKEIVLSRIESSDLLTVKKETKIKYKDRYIDFPFQKNIHQLPKSEFIDCLCDLYFSGCGSDKGDTFKSMVYSNLGKSISEKFLIPYNEKLYACDLDSLDSDAMGRFFPKCNFNDVISNFQKANNNSYNDTFVYPKGGAIQYIDSIFKQIKNPNLLLNSPVHRIDVFNKLVYVGDKSYKYDNLISTLPITALLDICDIEYNKEVFTNNKVLVFNLGFNKKGTDSSSSWIYFPEKSYSFYRVGFYDNIMQTDRMSLYVEIGYRTDENIDIDEMLKIVLSDLKKAGIVTSENLVSYSAVVMDPAYVHISKEAMKELNVIKQRLEDLSIYSIGRYGSWTYCSIEDNIKEAESLAQTIMYKECN